MISDSAKLTRLNNFSPEEGLAAEVHRTKNVMKCVYDFAVLGGGVGAHALVDDLGNPAVLPAGSIITRAYVESVTDPTSGGLATIALQAQAAADLLAATGFASITGFVDGKPDGTAAKFVQTTGSKQVSAVVAVAALTAGKFNVFVEYVIGK